MNADTAPDLVPTDLVDVQERLLEKARSARAGRAAETVYAGPRMRQTALALLADAALAEHDSPPEATLHVLVGRVRMNGSGRAWELGAGELTPIPPERHSVLALEDSAFLLTVLRADPPPAPAAAPVG